MQNIEKEITNALDTLHRTINKKYTIVPVFNTIHRPVYEIRKDIHNNYVHEPTKLIFNKDTKKAIGKYDADDQNILPLTEQDIEVCHQYKFDYDMPLTLESIDELVKEIDDLIELPE
jgi:hypothetical protein